MSRELSDPSKRCGESVHSLAGEVVEVMKGVCGREEFGRAYSVVHRRAMETREKRRKQTAMEVSGRLLFVGTHWGNGLFEYPTLVCIVGVCGCASVCGYIDVSMCLCLSPHSLSS